MRASLLFAASWLAVGCGPSLSQVKRYAEARQLQPDAPVQAESTVEIAAPVEVVWRIFTLVDEWPRWNDDAKGARLLDAFAPGTSFVYGAGTQHELTLAVVEAPRFLSFYGTFAGYKGVTLWSFEPLGPLKTRATARESNDGFLISLFYGSPALEQHLSLWTSRLKAEAERRFGTVTTP